jgi:ceramide glucosyltransferase
MTAPILCAATFCISVTTVHLASIAIAIGRFRRGARRGPLAAPSPAVSLVRPLCGLDNYAADTLASTFAIDYPRYEILFCVAAADDPVVPLVRTLMARHTDADARLLVGDERLNNNPKLNNLAKGWRAAAHDWIVMADSNVLIPPDYIQLLLANWRPDTGLVASPPIGCRPEGFWANVECAFLNTYQARWQYAAESLGFGFAQGKTMLWRRAELERAGGIAALAKEVAEDAAATKIVRSAGLKVRLVDRPFPQPLGRRNAAEVWHRQVRWARLRRASFLLYFLPEIFSGGVLPMIAIAVVANGLGVSPVLSAGLFGAFWYAAEMLLAAVAGWPLSPLSPLYGIMRDLLLPALFVNALRGSDFVWRGNEMQVERMRPRRAVARMRPRRVMARMRPRVQEIAQEVAAASRKRLRALRARAM